MVPQEQVQPRDVEQIFDVPLSQIVEKVPDVVKVFPQKHASEFIVEQTVDEPVPPVMEEENAEHALQTIPHECASEQVLRQRVAKITEQLSE